MSKPVLQIIVGSTRPGRAGSAVAQWFHGLAVKHDVFAAQLIELADVALPLFDEPNPPRLGKYEHDHTRRWSQIVCAADEGSRLLLDELAGYAELLAARRR